MWRPPFTQIGRKQATAAHRPAPVRNRQTWANGRGIPVVIGLISCAVACSRCAVLVLDRLLAEHRRPGKAMNGRRVISEVWPTRGWIGQRGCLAGLVIACAGNIPLWCYLGEFPSACLSACYICNLIAELTEASSQSKSVSCCLKLATQIS